MLVQQHRLGACGEEGRESWPPVAHWRRGQVGGAGAGARAGNHRSLARPTNASSATGDCVVECSNKQQTKRSAQGSNDHIETLACTN